MATTTAQFETDPAIGWRQRDTPELREAFAAAQTRLDECEIREGGGYTTVGVEHYTRDMIDADQKLADRYDRLVLQPAHAELERQCEDAEFAARWPEPPDGARIEWEGDDGTLYAAFRQDLPECEEGSWWTYGSGYHWSWRHLVCEYRIPEGPDVTMLAEAPGTVATMARAQKEQAVAELAERLAGISENLAYADAGFKPLTAADVPYFGRRQRWLQAALVRVAMAEAEG